MFNSLRRLFSNQTALLALFLSILTLVTFFLSYTTEELFKIVWSDAQGYYQYLPGLFIDHDLKNLVYGARLENGNMLNIFHIGVAILQLPFFFLADLLAGPLGYKTDGYSPIYMYSLGVGAAVYLGLGVYFLQQFLLRYFSLGTVVTTVLILFFGTNLYYYSSIEVGMSHVYSFFLFSAFALLSQRFFDVQSYPRAAIIGLLAGLIIVIRPNNGIFVLLLIFFGLSSFKEILPRFKWWLTNYRFVLVMFLTGGFICFLQMWYWHHVSDKWIMFSYGQLGQQFFWTKALMGKVLFSPQNGLLVYAPVLLFALIGLIWGSIKKQKGFFLYFLIWVGAWYIFSSWWCWWFGGAYGHRAFIEYFVVMAPGLAWFIERISRKKWALIPWSLVVLVLLFVSVRMSFIYYSPWDGPEWGWDDYMLKLGESFFVEPIER